MQLLNWRQHETANLENGYYEKSLDMLKKIPRLFTFSNPGLKCYMLYDDNTYCYQQFTVFLTHTENLWFFFKASPHNHVTLNAT